MKKIVFIAGIGLLFTLPVSGGSAHSILAPIQNPPSWEWQPTADFGGTPTWFSAAFTIGGKAYIVTGYEFGKAVWQYDPDRDAWLQKADFPGRPRGSAISFSIGNKGYVGLGYGEGERFSDLWEYDPGADRWKEKAALPAAGRDHAGAFAFDDRAIVFGGTKGEQSGNQDFLKEVWSYEAASDRWTRKADMPERAATPACFVLNGKGYFGTGILAVVPYTLGKTFWEYDPTSDVWTRKAEFPGAARYKAVGLAVGGKGYIGTGITSMDEARAGVLGDLWEYDPKTNAWTQKPPFSGISRGAAVGFVLDGGLVIGTGTDSRRNLLRDFWRMRPPDAGR